MSSSDSERGDKKPNTAANRSGNGQHFGARTRAPAHQNWSMDSLIAVPPPTRTVRIDPNGFENLEIHFIQRFHEQWNIQPPSERIRGDPEDGTLRGRLLVRISMPHVSFILI